MGKHIVTIFSGALSSPLYVPKLELLNFENMGWIKMNYMFFDYNNNQTVSDLIKWLEETFTADEVRFSVYRNVLDVEFIDHYEWYLTTVFKKESDALLYKMRA